MPQITVRALYQHPVKSMTPQQVETLELTSDGRVKGDRVLGFRFKDAGDPSDWSWQTKRNFVGLVNTPELAKLSVQFDQNTRTLEIHTDELLLTAGAIDSETDRAQIQQSISDYVLTLDVNPFTGHPERSPAVLVGDGAQPLFHDGVDGLLTLHSEESLTALAGALSDSALDGRRFRSNIVVSGVSEPFGEMSWVGRTVRLGSTEFDVIKPVTRCLVTHANPATGQRDHDVMNALVRHFTPKEPQFGVILKLASGPRLIEAGNALTLLD